MGTQSPKAQLLHDNPEQHFGCAPHGANVLKENSSIDTTQLERSDANALSLVNPQGSASMSLQGQLSNEESNGSLANVLDGTTSNDTNQLAMQSTSSSNA